MPELPEVEVVKRSLEKKIQNLIIKKVKIIDGNLRYKVNKDLLPKLVGKRIRQIERRSKYLILKINFDLFLLVHLGMTGKFFFINSKKKRFKTSFYYKVQKKKDKRYDKIVFFFKKNQKLIYNDIRKFGFIKFYANSEYSEISHLKKLGPEPLENEFNFNYFKKKIIHKNRMVKDVMMDQTFVSGLGIFM